MIALSCIAPGTAPLYLSRMTLEDHLGDIIRKAREAANVNVDAAAQAGGLSADQLQQLEKSGETAKQPDLARLGSLVQLNGQKLQAIAKGWLPKPVELANWREVRQVTTEGEGYTVNAYLVWDEVNREAAIFDTGWDPAPILKIIDENQLQPKHLFITHSHDDHIAGLAKIRERFPKIRIHSGSKHAPPDQRNRANDFIHLGNLRITNRETPGHAEDGVTYIVGNFPEDASNIAIVGDCIFAGSMGRGFQSTDLLKQKVREQIFTLPADTIICPGHGPLTTVGEEKAHNPFF
ncbi:MAG: Transcriptional regulator, family [Verrucomicrobiales bacterium]|nr:Transcriptional regulator, family [Verrucomicrobiales bacterium]